MPGLNPVHISRLGSLDLSLEASRSPIHRVFSRSQYHSGLRRFAPFSNPWSYIGVVPHKLYSTRDILQIHVQARIHVSKTHSRAATAKSP